jgi:hypothetical protein
MTAGSNGTPEPENDDPFAYLYRGEGEPAAAPSGPGVPRTSYNQVSRVGERRQAPSQGGGYGYPNQQGYGQRTQVQPQPHPHNGAPGGPPAQGGDGRGAPGSNRRGLMLGAIAVVVVVAVGIGVAAITGDDSPKDPNGSGASQAPAQTSSPGQSSSASAGSNANLPQMFAAALTLSGGAKTNTDHQGAQGPGGAFVDGMDAPGAAATWNVAVPRTGSYTLWVRYANADKNKATATVVTNGKPLAWKINLSDYVGDGNWDHWFSSYVTVNLNQGTNTVALTCGTGDVCNFNLDRLGLAADAGSGTPQKPAGWS